MILSFLCVSRMGRRFVLAPSIRLVTHFCGTLIWIYPSIWQAKKYVPEYLFFFSYFYNLCTFYFAAWLFGYSFCFAWSTFSFWKVQCKNPLKISIFLEHVMFVNCMSYVPRVNSVILSKSILWMLLFSL